MYTVVLGLPVVNKSALTDTLLNEWMKAGTIKIRDDLRPLCNKLLIYEIIKLRFTSFMGFFGIFPKSGNDFTTMPLFNSSLVNQIVNFFSFIQWTLSHHNVMFWWQQCVSSNILHQRLFIHDILQMHDILRKAPEKLKTDKQQEQNDLLISDSLWNSCIWHKASKEYKSMIIPSITSRAVRML